jgi:hypothetical protein
VTLDATTALGLLPQGLRTELLNEFNKIVRNYRETRWEATELDGGRFCEVVYSILAGHVDGDNYPPNASKPARFNEACRKLENADASRYSDSARLTIPRVLVGLYDVRNRRGVGHVGGEVNANHMDATFVLHTAQWVMAELIRMFHATDVSTAQATVDVLVDRTVPLVWQVGDVLRVLDPSMRLSDATLLLLYSVVARGMQDRALASNLEQERLANYRRVLHQLHEDRYVEYDRRSGAVVISPRGERYVEEGLVAKLQ